MVERPWETIRRPEILDAATWQRLFREWDGEFGVDNWRLVWRIVGSVLGIDAARVLYEDAYFMYLEEHHEIASALQDIASNVVAAAEDERPPTLDYRSDPFRPYCVAIRRVLVRRGQWFKGDEPVVITERPDRIFPISDVLSPYVVPFHRQDWMVHPLTSGEWRNDSVECFFRSNRFLEAVLPADYAIIDMALNTEEGVYYDERIAWEAYRSMRQGPTSRDITDLVLVARDANGEVIRTLS